MNGNFKGDYMNDGRNKEMRIFLIFIQISMKRK